MNLLAGVSIFAAAFLLFSLEPLIAKRIVPWFGGSSAVWSVCLVFYQVALLAGYAYARWIARYLQQRQQAVLHTALIAASVFLLPIGPTARWKPGAESDPAWAILLLLTATVGLPFAVLSATSPLLQDWLARAGEGKPYRLFSLSNSASLAALLLYPLLIEPHWNTGQQSLGWSFGFGAFGVTCLAFLWRAPKFQSAVANEKMAAPAPVQRFYWIALSACGSMLLLSITNHIDENVAAVPLLWVLPLAVYLISFIVAFGSRVYQRAIWVRLLAFGLALLTYAEYNTARILPLQISIPIFLVGLYIVCVFCHSELYRLRPANAALTAFYLHISAGGALGAIFVGLVAPQIFNGVYEFPLALVLTAGMALALTWNSGQMGLRVLWTVMTAGMLVVVAVEYRAYHYNAIRLDRSFYGSLRVLQSPEKGPDQMRSLFHGVIRHGDQFLWPSRTRQATTYYGPESGVGLVLRNWPPFPKRVAIVGLGSGTLAAYGRPGDTFRFYDINPQMIGIAKQYFSYLNDSPAQIQIVEGDARLSLEHEHVAPFDVIVLDAFSGDAIPVHLLTREAMHLYQSHLKPGGVIAFHVSNNFLDLAPIVCRLASDSGDFCLVVDDENDDDNAVLASKWVLVSTSKPILQQTEVASHASAVAGDRPVALWTDDFNSLLPILKTPPMSN